MTAHDLDFDRHASELRASFGPVGVWWSPVGTGPAATERAAVAEIEQLGFGGFWFGENARRKDAMAHAAYVLASTSTIMVATGLANVWSRIGATAYSAAAALGEAFDERFVLGLGISHGPIAALVGADFSKPLSTMRSYLDAMDEAPYEAARPAGGVRRILGALKPRMLELARDRSAGVHTYLTPLEHVAVARGVIGHGRFLAPELGFVLEPDPDRARQLARSHVEHFLELPNYSNNLREFGFQDEDFERGGSDRLIDSLVAWGDQEAIAGRVQEFLDAGADHVCLQPLHESIPAGLEALRTLAPAVLPATAQTR